MVFLTGATGVMGTAGLKELMKYPERYEVTVLARDSKKNRKKLRDWEKRGVKIVWGDLLDAGSLRQGIRDADIVLHVGGMVSPVADHYPEKTKEVNIGSARLISGIIKEIEEQIPEREIAMVYIGSVAQYGSKLPPNHWGNAEDEQKAASMDAYAESKIEGEKAVREAGLKKWVSIRQTSILHRGLLRNAGNPVIFHTPPGGVLEWITEEDSGRLLERLCREEVPESFWGKGYNAGGGEKFRMKNSEFERALLKAIGCPPPEKIFDTKWFAADNFHGMWFEDSDALDGILHFREEDDFQSAIRRLKKRLPFYFKLAPLAPSFLIRSYMRRVASKPILGPLWWIKQGDEDRIKACWGSLKKYEELPGWEEIERVKLDRVPPCEKN